MTLLFSTIISVILATNRFEAFLMKNDLRKYIFTDQPLWSSIFLDEALFKKHILLETELLKDNRNVLDFNKFTSSENLMFTVLCYKLVDTEITDEFINALISDHIVNIVNPVRFSWATDYVKYIISQQKIYPNVQIINDNITKRIIYDFTTEWAFSKILYVDEDTWKTLRMLFPDEIFDSSNPINNFETVLQRFVESGKDLNLYVVYLEALRYLKRISKSNIYYELCGVSSYLFARLYVIETFMRHRLFYKQLVDYEKGLNVLLNLQQNMISLYFCAKFVEYYEEQNIPVDRDVMIYLLFMCLQLDNSRRYLEIIEKAFDCITSVSRTHHLQGPTPMSTKFLNYFKCYVIPMSVFLNKYIQDLHEMLSKEYMVCDILDHSLYYNFQAYYRLTMFLIRD